MREDITRRAVLRSGALVGTGLVSSSAQANSGEKGNAPDRHIVGTRSGAGRRAARRAADTVRHELDFGKNGTAVAGRFPEAAREALVKRDDVRYVEPDGTVQLLGQTANWGVKRVEAPLAHGDGYDGSGADVAIIDTGIDATHEDLEANLGEGHAVVSCSSNCAAEWDDDNGHGTHVAGIVGAVDNAAGVLGVAHDCTLHAVKVGDSDGGLSISDVAAGLEWVANQGYDVANLSLGTSPDYSTLRDACQYAHDEGVLMAAAAGNDGCDGCVLYPAAYSTVVAVGASDDDDEILYFSNTGPEIELAAPGGGPSLYSTVIGGYDYKRGTSMAAPYVAGAGAVLMANGDTNTEARERLQATAEDIGHSDTEQGYGLVDVDAAVDDGTGDGGETAVAVSTDSPTAVEETSATVNGTLSDLGGADSADCYIRYRGVGADSWSATAVQTLSSTGSFSDDVTGLDSGVEYEYEAVAEATDGDAGVGDLVTFATGNGSVAVSTADTSGVTSTSVTLEGSLDDLGGAYSVDCYFEWRAADASQWNKTAVQTLSSTGAFDDDVSGLEDGAEYEFRGVAEASDGDVDTGSVVTVTTADDPPAVTTESASDVTENGATLEGSLDELGNADSVDCYFEYREAGATSWTAQAAESLSSVGSFSTQVDGLSSGTEYDHRAVAEASDGDSDTGGTVSFTTDGGSSGDTAPAIDAYSVSEAGSPNPHAEITADWVVSDVDGDLSVVEVEVTDGSNSLVDANRTSVSGESASGTDTFNIKHVKKETFDVTVTVTDSADHSAGETQSITE